MINEHFIALFLYSYITVEHCPLCMPRPNVICVHSVPGFALALFAFVYH